MMGSRDFLDKGTSLDRPESLLLDILSNCSGTVRGRTKLMKLVFFSEYYQPETEELGSDENLGVFDNFIIYNHGPFSRNVMDSFDILKEKGLVEESTELTYSGDRRKVIKLTNDGDDMTDEIDQSELVQETISEFCDESGLELEEKSLDLLGISREEKPKYRFKDVSDIIGG